MRKPATALAAPPSPAPGGMQVGARRLGTAAQALIARFPAPDRHEGGRASPLMPRMAARMAARNGSFAHRKGALPSRTATWEEAT